MTENLIFSINTVLPLLIFVALGYILRRNNIFGESFYSDIDRFVFKIALPCMIFLDVLECDVAKLTDIGLISFAFAGITLTVAILFCIIPLTVRENDRRGAMIQGIFRSNFAVLGVSLAGSIAGDEGLYAMAVLMPIAIILFNAYAVITLSVFAPEGEKKSAGTIALEVGKNIITNPLIIAVATALIFVLIREYAGFSLPEFLITSVSRLSDTVYALALVSLGAGITVKSLRGGKLRLAVIASVCKTVLLPAAAVAIAAALGFRTARIAVIFILFGAPAAISSYIMAKNMKSDSELAGQILVISTVMSLFTVFAGTFLLKTFKLI